MVQEVELEVREWVYCESLMKGSPPKVIEEGVGDWFRFQLTSWEGSFNASTNDGPTSAPYTTPLP